MPVDLLPLGSHGILNDEGIWGEQDAIGLECLTYKHPITRISMVGGQLVR